MEILEFIQKISPSLIALARELYDHFDGDAQAAIDGMGDVARNIRDRRPEIAEMRARREAERKAKRKPAE